MVQGGLMRFLFLEQVNVLEREKELISNAEKRASQELSSLSDRVHRLQVEAYLCIPM